LNNNINKDKGVLLSIRVDPTFLPVATSFVENSALAFGLNKKEALALTLATEEIFLYLIKASSTDHIITIRCSSGIYYVKADFLFSANNFNMRAFNLTTTISPHEEASLEEMGLLIASRSVDRLQVKQEGAQSIHLILTKEKSYPSVDEFDLTTLPSVENVVEFSIKSATGEDLKLFVMLLNSHYKSFSFPKDFRFPGKVVDMVRSGEYEAVVAIDQKERIIGGTLWHWLGSKTVECFGPYIFTQGSDLSIAERLIEECIKAIAKSDAVGLINRYPTLELPKDYFEPLGSLTFFTKGSSSFSITAYFRQMQEDLGSTVWSHPALEEFLKEEYKRLVLPRMIRLVRDQGETKEQFSVLSAEFDRINNFVTLRPLCSGLDSDKNIGAHLDLFKKESLSTIFFEMDLGKSWQVEFVPALFNHNFKPRIILPYGGIGDIVLFQLGEKH